MRNILGSGHSTILAIFFTCSLLFDIYMTCVSWLINIFTFYIFFFTTINIQHYTTSTPHLTPLHTKLIFSKFQFRGRTSLQTKQLRCANLFSAFNFFGFPNTLQKGIFKPVIYLLPPLALHRTKQTTLPLSLLEYICICPFVLLSFCFFMSLFVCFICLF